MRKKFEVIKSVPEFKKGTILYQKGRSKIFHNPLIYGIVIGLDYLLAYPEFFKEITEN